MQEGFGPGRDGVGGAAVGEAGAVVEGEEGGGVVEVVAAGGGQLLEGGAREQGGSQRRGASCGWAVAAWIRRAASAAWAQVRGSGAGRCLHSMGSGVQGPTFADTWTGRTTHRAD